MFEVWTRSPSDSMADDRHCLLLQAAGRHPECQTVVGGTGGGPGQVHYGWMVLDFVDAVNMRRRLAAVDDVVAIVKEQTTALPRGRK